MATGNHLIHMKKKITRDQHLLCAIQKEKGDIRWFYCFAYFFLTGNDLGIMGVFFQKIVIKLTKWMLKFLTAWNSVYTVFISMGKI